MAGRIVVDERAGDAAHSTGTASRCASRTAAARPARQAPARPGACSSRLLARGARRRRGLARTFRERVGRGTRRSRRGSWTSRSSRRGQPAGRRGPLAGADRPAPPGRRAPGGRARPRCAAMRAATRSAIAPRRRAHRRAHPAPPRAAASARAAAPSWSSARSAGARRTGARPSSADAPASGPGCGPGTLPDGGWCGADVCDTFSGDVRARAPGDPRRDARSPSRVSGVLWLERRGHAAADPRPARARRSSTVWPVTCFIAAISVALGHDPAHRAVAAGRLAAEPVVRVDRDRADRH